MAALVSNNRRDRLKGDAEIDEIDDRAPRKAAGENAFKSSLSTANCRKEEAVPSG